MKSVRSSLAFSQRSWCNSRIQEASSGHKVFCGSHIPRSEFRFERRIGPLLPLPEQLAPLTGRLGCSCEEANIRHR